MKQPRDADWSAIERLLAGEGTPADEQRVNRWAQQHPENEALLRRLEAAWRAAAVSGRHYDSRAAWSKLQQQMQAAPASASRHAPHRPRARAGTLRTALQWAAALVLLVSGGILLGRVVRESSPPLIASEVSTGAGQRATVRLGDGSVVVLGPQSRLADATGVKGERRIELRGSGYFNVVHDERRPFVVKVGSAETRVLGTTFGVRAYGNGTPLEVVVESGSVSVRAATQHPAVVLRPGQSGRVQADGRVVLQSQVDVAALLSWREGRLTFQGTPLSEVAAEIQRWYGIEVIIADSAIATYPLTATFTAAQVAEVLTVVSRSLGVRHSFDGSTAEFHP